MLRTHYLGTCMFIRTHVYPQEPVVVNSTTGTSFPSLISLISCLHHHIFYHFSSSPMLSTVHFILAYLHLHLSHSSNESALIFFVRSLNFEPLHYNDIVRVQLRCFINLFYSVFLSFSSTSTIVAYILIDS